MSSGENIESRVPKRPYLFSCYERNKLGRCNSTGKFRDNKIGASWLTSKTAWVLVLKTFLDTECIDWRAEWKSSVRQMAHSCIENSCIESKSESTSHRHSRKAKQRKSKSQSTPHHFRMKKSKSTDETLLSQRPPQSTQSYNSSWLEYASRGRKWSSTYLSSESDRHYQGEYESHGNWGIFQDGVLISFPAKVNVYTSPLLIINPIISLHTLIIISQIIILHT